MSENKLWDEYLALVVKHPIPPDVKTFMIKLMEEILNTRNR